MRNIFPIIFILMLAACGNNSGQGSANKDDSSNVQICETYMMDTAISSVSWEHYKKAANTNSNFSLGKVNISMNVANVEYTSNGNFAVVSGEWVLEKNVGVSGTIVVDLSKTAALKVGKDKKLEVGNPDYLDIEKYPTAKIEFSKIELNKDSIDIKAKLTIKDTTGSIEFPAKIKWTNSVPEVFKAKFSIDGKKWGLINKNATGSVIADKLTFDCNIKASTKPAKITHVTKNKE